MSDLADRHRLIGDVLEPLERMGVDAEVNERTADDGELYLALELRVPSTLEPADAGEAAQPGPVGGAGSGPGGDGTERRPVDEAAATGSVDEPAEAGPGDEPAERGASDEAAERGPIGGQHAELLEAQCEQLREERDAARERADELLERAETLEERVAELEDRDDAAGADEPDAEGLVDPTVGGADASDPDDTDASDPDDADTSDPDDADATGADDGATADLTDGERETLRALRRLGGSSASGEIADEVDATLQSVRSWLPKLVQLGHVRTEPDPTDGRRKLYSAVECDGPTDEEGAEDADDSVYIASSGGSPSQVFHVRRDCPQLQKSADSVEKDRSVVPHHRPCGTCVPDGLEEGLVAIAKGSPTSTYHKREDCPKLESAVEVDVRERGTVPNHDPCHDCVDLDEVAGRPGDDGDDTAAVRICAGNDLGREAVVEALDSATAIYHVQRELALSSDETEALLRDLGVFGDLEGGGRVSRDRAKSVAREHVPPATELESHGGENSG